MRLHLDTSFLIDWYENEPGAVGFGNAIKRRDHDVTVDPIVETEYFAAPRIAAAKRAFFAALLIRARRLPITPEASHMAAGWLAHMDQRQRRAHFADALIAAVATVDGAALLTGDTRTALVFPVQVVRY